MLQSRLSFCFNYRNNTNVDIQKKVMRYQIHQSHVRNSVRKDYKYIQCSS